MNVAIVQDFLNQQGGAERCLTVLRELFQDAPIYTLVHDPHYLQDADVRASFVQRLPFSRRNHYFYLPFYPRAIEQFDLGGYDVVLSSSAAFAKNLRKPPGVLHICLCYTPMRFVHVTPDAYLQRVPGWARPLARLALAKLGKWDLARTSDVDHFIAISRAVQERIRTHYGRGSTVIYPPVDVEYFTPGGRSEDFYLIVSRLVVQKRLEVAIEAFRRLGKKLKIVGTGPEANRLRRAAGAGVEMLGYVDDSALRNLYRRCRALVHPAEDDFGIAPVEAQACGKPVIAYAGGGLLETIEEGRTGHFFQRGTTDDLSAAVTRFEEMDFDPEVARRSAMRFSRNSFKEKIGEFVLQRYQEWRVRKERPSQ
jgi:glycosyltransferase involved in cell wall biosynthesis